MPSEQLTDLTATLRTRLSEIDTELATFDALTDERARIVAALDALEGGAATPAPAAPRRKKAARRAGRTPAKRGEAQAAIVEYLRSHPGSSASAIATELGLKRNSTSTRLTQMAKDGLIGRSDGRGYELPAGEAAAAEPATS